jgi:hypothetical protein
VHRHGPEDPTKVMSSALGDFKTVIQTLHELLNVIDKEVTETIDSRDPNKVSATLAPLASAELPGAYRSSTKHSDKLASFAADALGYRCDAHRKVPQNERHPGGVCAWNA